MTAHQRKASTPGEHTAAPDEDRTAQRNRLAELLGRLLARYWLRFGERRGEAPETETPAPTQE
jgi:hypothetical protein